MLILRRLDAYIALTSLAICVTAVSLGHWVVGGAAVLFGGCLIGLRSPVAPHKVAPSSSLNEELVRTRATSGEGDHVGQLLGDGRYALLLRAEIAAELTGPQAQLARDALERASSLSPGGEVLLQDWRNAAGIVAAGDVADHMVDTDDVYFDRFVVSNEDYFAFVVAGGYQQETLWHECIRANLASFVDSNGAPGPRFWTNGRYPLDQGKRPVVGVSWYEACAYARWVGKRLPSDAEWVKAASWPTASPNGRPVQRRFPWGDTMDRRMTHLWSAGSQETIDVDALPEGASVGGLQQMVGNVWEWTDDDFSVGQEQGPQVETLEQMKVIRGGAFDTYFDCHASCHFHSADSLLARKRNIGFRCAVGACDVAASDHNVCDVDACDVAPVEEYVS